ncbi:MAG: CapA family protein [Pseudomonadales bacterium]|jgi:poly-gamma-glutamate capsule biosynthesis protein CapA/YwtB (metallophosphatase superfamily)|nr:CapA family protein [Pseudomonadales bacterium]
MNMPIDRRSLLQLLALSPLLTLPPLTHSASTAMRVTLTGQALMKYPICDAPYPGLDEVIAELQRGDVIFTNLEVPIQTAESGLPTRDTEFFHVGSAQTLSCLQLMGFNLLALSNNHAFDLSTEGITATRKAVATAGFAHAGSGDNATLASAAGILEEPFKTGLVSMAMGNIREGGAATATRPGINEVRLGADLTPNQEDLSRNLKAIAEAKAASGFVIAYLHNHEWGEDMAETKPWAREFAQNCIDAGADIFVSHGAPLLHGIEIYRGKVVLHGLGSLVFHSHTEVGYYVPEVWESAIVHLDFEEGMFKAMEIVPMAMNEAGDNPEQHWPSRGRPRLASLAQADEILQRLQALSAALGVALRVENGRGVFP